MSRANRQCRAHVAVRNAKGTEDMLTAIIAHVVGTIITWMIVGGPVGL